ncbi:MAG: type 4a pilus biogenesis protein PilO [Proteobacteria bacterium]|nr:type 4a pilus biogenesis protein PilO [Pseudomonadota bacterium]
MKIKKIDISKITEPLFKTIDKIGKLSKLYRMLISLGIILVFAAPLIYFSYLPKIRQIEELGNQYAELDSKLTTLRAKVRQLRPLTKKLEEAENEFKVVMKALPEKKEIPTLLASVSQSGKDAGLDFDLFQPQNETGKEFYAEIPVAIQVRGNYHSVAMFFDKVSRLSRIVNIDNIRISAQKDAKKGFGVATSCTAITYRFLEKK